MCLETPGATGEAWSWQAAAGLGDALSWGQATAPLLPQTQGQGTAPFALKFLLFEITLRAVAPTQQTGLMLPKDVPWESCCSSCEEHPRWESRGKRGGSSDPTWVAFENATGFGTLTCKSSRMQRTGKSH